MFCDDCAVTTSDPDKSAKPTDAEPDGMIDDQGELPGWDVLSPPNAPLVRAQGSPPASQDVRDEQRRSGARWGALGMVLGVVGLLIAVVGGVVLGFSGGLIVGIVVLLAAVAAIGFGYYRFWLSGQN